MFPSAVWITLPTDINTHYRDLFTILLFFITFGTGQHSPNPTFKNHFLPVALHLALPFCMTQKRILIGLNFPSHQYICHSLSCIPSHKRTHYAESSNTSSQPLLVEAEMCSDTMQILATPLVLKYYQTFPHLPMFQGENCCTGKL